MFESKKKDLKELLEKIHEGKLQLPDFQRNYVWDEENVKSLLASIAKGFPVGALLTLETGGEVNFKPRLLFGVPNNNESPTELLLDGQQRMTTLYQASFSKKPVNTLTRQKKRVKRFYYIDIEKAVSSDADIEDAIIGVLPSRIVTSNFGRDVELDLSKQEYEFENKMFPLNQVFDYHDWAYPWRDYWKKQDVDISELDKDFYKNIVQRIDRYSMPLISLDKENSREAICLVFEKVNVGGKKLDAFELVTAIFASDEYDLREDWLGPSDKLKLGRKARLLGEGNPRDVLKEIKSTDFLQACTLLHTREQRLSKEEQGYKDKELPQVSCKREALLGLPLQSYKKFADAIEKGFIEGSSFVNELRFFWHKDIPYPSQLVALASVYALLDSTANTVAAKKKLSEWFWCITFGELYSSSTDTRLARDVVQMTEWISGTEEKPRSINDALFQYDRLKTLKSRNSAAYKGLYALLMMEGCRDFIEGKEAQQMNYFQDKIDIHHIFPAKWCKANNIPPKVYDSIINKTPLSAESNRKIGGDAPSVYLKKFDSDELDDILRTHLIEPEYLRNDDFEAFYNARMNKLAGLIEDAMNKPVVRGQTEEESEPDANDYDEDDEELAEIA